MLPLENLKRFNLMKQVNLNTDFVDKFTSFRDITKSTCFGMTNDSLHATHLSCLPTGLSKSTVIPDFVKSPKSVSTLEVNGSTKRKNYFNVCVFRAFAATRLGSMKNLDAKMLTLFNLHKQGVQKNVADFIGIEIRHLTIVKNFCSCASGLFSA